MQHKLPTPTTPHIHSMKTDKHPNPKKHNQDTILQIHNGTKIKILNKRLEKRKEKIIW